MERLSLTRGELEGLLSAIVSEVTRQVTPPGNSEIPGVRAGAGTAHSFDAAQAPAHIDIVRASAIITDADVRLNDDVRALAGLIDHTLLRPDARASDIEKLCDEALRVRCAAVCVNPGWVPLVAGRLRGSGVMVTSVIGFPFGATSTSAKRAEAEAAILEGAQELDMVMNIGAMKSGELGRVQVDIAGVAEICRASGARLKVILETCYLRDEEKASACKIAVGAGADFVKTSTGFGPSGATDADVRLMRQAVGETVGVKAAGGIRTLNDALRMLQAGATRLGTSSGVSILEEAFAIASHQTEFNHRVRSQTVDV